MGLSLLHDGERCVDGLFSCSRYVLLAWALTELSKGQVLRTVRREQVVLGLLQVMLLLGHAIERRST